MAPVRILLCGFSLTGNKGGPAVVDGACRAIREFLPDAEISLLSTAARLDGAVAGRYGISVVDAKLSRSVFAVPVRAVLWRVFRFFGLDARRLTNDPVLRACREADAFIDVTGISFSDDLNWKSSVKHTLNLLPPILLGRPAIGKFPHASGPHRRTLTRFLARRCLKRCRWVLARGEASEEHLRKLGGCRRLATRADPAFLMPPCDAARVDEILAAESIPADRGPLVGVSPSFVMHRKAAAGGDLGQANRYEDVLAELVGHVQEAAGATIVFVPHSCVRGAALAEAGGAPGGQRPSVERRLMGLSRLDEDDAWVARVIRDRLERPEATCLIEGDYAPDELKGVIGRCEAYVASRYHSMVAALSSGVPTMAVGWSHKYAEVLGMFRQQERACLLSDMSAPRLKALFDALWDERHDVARQLREHLGAVKASALSAGELVASLVQRRDGQ